MTTTQNTFEGGTAGAAIVVSNSGGASGDPISSYSAPTGSAITFSTAAALSGSLGMEIATTAVDVAAYVEFDVTAANRHAYRHPIKFSAQPNVRTPIGRYRNLNASATTVCSPLIDENNHLALYDAIGTLISTSVGSYAVQGATKYIYELAANGITGDGTWNLYAANGTTLLDSKTVTGQNFGGAQIGKVRFGRTSGSSFVGSIYYDDLNMQDLASGFPAALATVSAGTDQSGVEPGSTVTLTATSSTGSVVWSQVSGPTVTLTGSGALTRTFVAPARFAFTTAVFRATASGSADDISVAFLPATSGYYNDSLVLVPAEFTVIQITGSGFGRGGFGVEGFGR